MFLFETLCVEISQVDFWDIRIFVFCWDSSLQKCFLAITQKVSGAHQILIQIYRSLFHTSRAFIWAMYELCALRSDDEYRFLWCSDVGPKIIKVQRENIKIQSGLSTLKYLKCVFTSKNVVDSYSTRQELHLIYNLTVYDQYLVFLPLWLLPC